MTGTCDCKNPSAVNRDGGLYCVACRKFLRSDSQNRDTMREELRREISKTRREFNRRLDALNARLESLV